MGEITKHHWVCCLMLKIEHPKEHKKNQIELVNGSKSDIIIYVNILCIQSLVFEIWSQKTYIKNLKLHNYFLTVTQYLLLLTVVLRKIK